jgi:ribosomal protein L18E
MLSLKRKRSETKPSSKQLRIDWIAFFKDLSFLGSLSLAHVIVWRVLRRRRKERAVRLKRIRLVHDAENKEG